MAANTPKIYVAILADYNNGVLNGKWIDADQSADEIEHEVKQLMLTSAFPNVTSTLCDDCGHIHLSIEDTECEECGSGAVRHLPSAEEWAIHDYDGLPNMGESASFESVAEMAEVVGEHGLELVDAYIDCFADDELAQLQERYIGEFNSRGDLAAYLVDEQGLLHGVPDTIQYYFDYDAYGRDIVRSGDVSESDRHYFWTH